MTIATPAVLLPDVPTNSAELSILMGAFAAAFVILEYGFRTPSLIEFRFAAPYNRFRFGILTALVLCLVLAFRNGMGSGASVVMAGFVDASLNFWSFAGSPLQGLVALARFSGPESQLLLAQASAVALSVSVIGVLAFGVSIVLFAWPLGKDNFNLWINMPMLEEQRGVGMQQNLRQSALMSLIIGVTLPYLAPLAAMTFMGPLGPVTALNSQFLVWMIAIWCFVPSMSLLRGIALYKVANLVKSKDDGALG